MSNLKELIKNKIKENKPKLNEKSITAYSIMLYGIYKEVFKNIDKPDLDNFYNYKPIIKYLTEKYEPSQRKTYLASLLTVAPEVSEYKTDMMKDIKIYNEEQLKQNKNDKELKNNITKNDINNKIDEYENLFYKTYGKDPDEITVKDFQNMQNYVLLCCCCGVYIPVRRSIDWTDMKITNINKDENNYIDLEEDKFIFNNYKTSKSFKKQVVKIPDKLLKIICNFLTVSLRNNKSGYLFCDDYYNKLSNIKLNYRFNKIFNGNISINQFRHLSVTDKLKGKGVNGVSIKELMQDADDMGHSLKQHLLYGKF